MKNWGIALTALVREKTLNRTIAQALRATIHKWDLMKLKNLCTANNTIIQTRQKSTEWEICFRNYTSNRRRISKIYKVLHKITKRPYCWSEDTNYVTYLTWRGWAGANLETSPLLTSALIARRCSVHYQMRNININAATNSPIYSGVLPARYVNEKVAQSLLD